MVSPTSLGVPHCLVIVFGIGFMVTGTFFLVQEPKASTCFGLNKNDTNVQKVKDLSWIAGAMLAGDGILSIIAGWFGICGGWYRYRREFAWYGVKRQKCLICISVVLVFLVLWILLGAVGAGAYGYLIAHGVCLNGVCDKRIVSSTGKYLGAVCRDTSLADYIFKTVQQDSWYCLADYEHFCDYETKSWVGLIVSCVAFLVVFAAVVWSCCACCRPVMFEIDDPPTEASELEKRRAAAVGKEES